MAMNIETDLSNRTAIVTGASTGIGKEIARGLARMGASVVLAVRDPVRGEAARADIARDARFPDRLLVLRVDLASQASIRSFATAFGRAHPKLHVLVNNAGCWHTEKRLSPDGIELIWATNVLGPHLLTQTLVPSLRAAGGARIVNVASTAVTKLEMDDVQMERRGFDGFKAYGQSKLANRMLTWSLASKLAAANVTVNAVAPGFVKTELNRSAGGVLGTMIPFFAKLFGSTPAEGADTAVWAAAAPELDGVTSKFFEKRRELACTYRDPESLERLFRVAEEMTAPARQFALAG